MNPTICNKARATDKSGFAALDVAYIVVRLLYHIFSELG